MRRTLWSLLVGAAAVFPAAQPALVSAETPVTPAVPTVAPEAHRVEEPKQVQLDRRDETDENPAPTRAIVPATPSAADLATLTITIDGERDLAVLARRTLRLPQPRAP